MRILQFINYTQHCQVIGEWRGGGVCELARFFHIFCTPFAGDWISFDFIMMQFTLKIVKDQVKMFYSSLILVSLEVVLSVQWGFLC